MRTKLINKDKRAANRLATDDPTRLIGTAATGGLIFLMLLYLSLTIYSSTKLAESTESISSHPFEVVIAAGDIKTHLSEMQIRAERLTKYNNSVDIKLVTNALESLFETIEAPLETVETQYLGEHEDVEKLKETLGKLEQELYACAEFAQGAELKEIEKYEETHLYSMYESAFAQLEHIISFAQARKLMYGEMAEKLRRNTLAGALVLIVLMIGGLLLSQYIQRRQRRELISRGLLFDDLSQSLDDRFLISDAKTTAIYYMAQDMEKVLGQPIVTVEDVCRCFSPFDADEIRRAINHPDFPLPFAREMKCVSLYGEERWISVKIYRAKGIKAPKVISVFSDCTEQILAQRNLRDAMLNAERANEAKSVFLSRMSHEIRTPLNAIIGMTTIAAASVKNPAKVQDCLGKINFSSKHLLMLINDVLDMSKIESDKMTLQKEPFDLFEAISRFVTTIYPQAKDKGIEFTELVEGFHGKAQYMGDSLRLNQILLNLGSNAVKFTPAGGSVRLSVSRIASHGAVDTLRFIIADTGIGMETEALERIFKPFEQADATIAGRFGGTGLGMSITKNLVTLMDGRIEVQSQPGAGTTCIVDLPFEHTDLTEELPDFTDQGLHALVVDDEQEVCEETAALLKNIKIQAEWVLDGATAVARVTEAQKNGCEFDLCLMDWKMPGMDGVEATRRIRANVGMNLPIVMISAYDCSEIEEEAKKAGVNDFLPKPLYRSSVYTTVKSALSRDKNKEEAGGAVSDGLRGKRLLVAEDNKLNREILSELLSMNGIEAECAVDGQEALDMYKRSSEGYYDAILMDVQMPVMDGYEATKRLRALKRPGAKSIPIIATTANAFSDDISATRSAGMNAHVSKPIDMEQLCRVLGDCF